MSWFRIADKSKSFPCFPGDVKVLTGNGYRAIASLRSGDYVISYDRRSGATKPRIVKRMLKYPPKRLCEIRLKASDAPIRATYGHSFLTQRGWLRTSQLRAGDVLICSEGINKEIAALKRLSEVEVVYNLITEGEHTFIVDHGVIAHNYSLLRDVRVAVDNLVAIVGKRLRARKIRLIERDA